MVLLWFSIFVAVRFTLSIGLGSDVDGEQRNHLVAHYRRLIRTRRSLDRDAAGSGYWPVDPSTGQQRRFHPASPGFLDIYIYAPARYTTKQAGQSVHLDCELSDGYAGIWKREHNMPFSKHANLKKLKDRNIYRLYLEELEQSDSGKYICSANTGVPADNEFVVLDVQGEMGSYVPDRHVVDEASYGARMEEQRRAQYEEEMIRRRQEQFWAEHDKVQRPSESLALDPYWSDNLYGETGRQYSEQSDDKQSLADSRPSEEPRQLLYTEESRDNDFDEQTDVNRYDDHGERRDEFEAHQVDAHTDGIVPSNGDDIDQVHHPYYQTQTTPDTHHWQRPVDFDAEHEQFENEPEIPMDQEGQQSEHGEDKGEQQAGSMVADHNAYTDYVYDYMVDD